jgi:hypothetical protein
MVWFPGLEKDLLLRKSDLIIRDKSSPMAINAIAGIIQKGKAGAGGSLGSLKRGPKIKTSDGKIIRGKGIITIQMASSSSKQRGTIIRRMA